MQRTQGEFKLIRRIKGIAFMYVTLICCVVTHVPAYAQNTTSNAKITKQTVKGKIVDEQDTPISDVRVQEIGTNNGTFSEVDGTFSLEVRTGATLQFSLIGYTVHTEAINGRSTIDIVLNSDINMLETVEIVATGYQNLRRTQITGSTSGLSGMEYDKTISPSGNVLAGLEGKVAGLVINPMNPDDISVRGVSTFNAVKQPLIVLDGFPTEISLDAINPNDVESIVLLKDAAAAAIYGVRASNGVLVIKTKRGKEGKPIMSFRSTFTTQEKADYKNLDLLTGQGFVDLSLLKKKQEGLAQSKYDDNFLSLFNRPYSPIWRTQFDLEAGRITEAEARAQFDNYANYNNFDDYSDLFYRNQFSTQFDFDISGGSDKATYFIGINRIDNNPTQKRSSDNKTTINLKSTVKLSTRMKLDASGMYSNVRTNSGVVPSQNFFEPYERLTDENGNALPVYTQPVSNAVPRNVATNKELLALGLFDQLYYPANELDAHRIKTNDNLMRAQAMLQTMLWEGIYLELGGSYELQNSLNTDLATADAWSTRRDINYFATPDASGSPIFNFPVGEVLKSNNATANAYTIRAQVTLDRMFAEKHSVTALFGAEQRERLYESNLSTSFGYDDQTLTSVPVNIATLVKGIGGFYGGGYYQSGSFFAPLLPYGDYFNKGYSDDRFVSFYGNVAYTYNERYVATGSARIDQSNLFGTDPKYRYKPLWSIGGAWLASNEDFLKDVSWLDNLKARVSYGFNGNVDKTTGPFLIVNSNIHERVPGFQIYNTPTNPPNKSLRWEQTAIFNGGIDYSILDGKIGGSIDAYYKKSTDLLSSTEIDPTLGFVNALLNSGSIVNKGLEFSLNTVNINTPKFRWSSQVTASFNKNKVLKTARPIQYSSLSYTRGSVVVEGQELGTLYSYDYAGVNNKGEPQVYTKNGDLFVLNFDNKQDVTLEDLVVSGTTIPKYVIGVNNQINVGNFDLYFLFMYYGGHVYRTHAPFAMDVRPINGSQYYWQKPGDEATVLQPSITSVYNNNGYSYERADIFVHKGDYIKMRNLILSYNIPASVYKKIGLTNAKLRLQAENLFKVSFNNSGVDPEFVEPVSGTRYQTTKPIYTAALYLNF